LDRIVKKYRYISWVFAGVTTVVSGYLTYKLFNGEKKLLNIIIYIKGFVLVIGLLFALKYFLVTNKVRKNVNILKQKLKSLLPEFEEFVKRTKANYSRNSKEFYNIINAEIQHRTENLLRHLDISDIQKLNLRKEMNKYLFNIANEA